jgi:hypothetical protein
LSEGLANELRRLHDALDLRRQGLPFNPADNRQCRCPGGDTGEEKQREARRTERRWSKHHDESFA